MSKAMKITTKVQLKWDEQAGRYFPDPETWEGYEYSGPVEECKGQDQAKQQLDAQNKLTQDQLTQQKAVRDQILGSVGKYLSGNVGFDPAQLAAMQSQFLNSNTSTYNQAGQAVMSALKARGAGGGDMPVGGDYTRGLEDLLGARATSQSQGLLGLNIQDAQQALNNKFNAASVASGQSAQLGQNVGTFNTGASNSLDQYVKAANSSPLMNMLGQVAGAGLGAFTGSIGASLGNKFMPKSQPTSQATG